MNIEYSPEQIAGMSLERIGISISTETIYKLVVADKLSCGGLYKKLRINGKRKRRKRVKAPETQGQIKHRVSIDKRPMVVEKRNRFGDWEADLICGANHKGFIVTLVECKSGLVRTGRVSHKIAPL